MAWTYRDNGQWVDENGNSAIFDAASGLWSTVGPDGNPVNVGNPVTDAYSSYTSGLASGSSLTPTGEVTLSENGSYFIVPTAEGIKYFVPGSEGLTSSFSSTGAITPVGLTGTGDQNTFIGYSEGDSGVWMADADGLNGTSGLFQGELATSPQSSYNDYSAFSPTGSGYSGTWYDSAPTETFVENVQDTDFISDTLIPGIVVGGLTSGVLGAGFDVGLFGSEGAIGSVGSDAAAGGAFDMGVGGVGEAMGASGTSGTGVISSALDTPWGVNPVTTDGASVGTTVGDDLAAQYLTEGYIPGVPLDGAVTGSTATLMPPAVPESSSTLSGYGLTETSPGVWTTPTSTTSSSSSTDSLLTKIINGTATTDDYVNAVSALLPSALGAYGASTQANAYGDLASQFASYGAPYRDMLTSLYADPTSFLTSPEVTVPVQQATDALARSLSVQGNPIGSGNALQELQNYSANMLFGKLGQEKDRLAGFGGLSAYNAAAPVAATNAVGADAGIWNSIGYGLNTALNPQPTISDLLKELNSFNTSSSLA